MGRIKTQQIKRLTKEFVKKHRGMFTDKFEDNKKLVEKVGEFNSKKLRNVIAGYVTRIVKEKQEIPEI
ncbi:30S ribosomal protein S17e [Candidatus Woesearchaeota archaeon]|nr:30S ribosomal protein S17e [Candidatus Woesearchaeota archaeon]MBW3017339.1 30S ribosomal protein S17e [Candidatus Woesearchaeota archaeon]